ncbi:spore germination protein GerW family protein [Amycolatopsis regifaucium]|uniref:Sporulation protein n=1 Tax=Amycolatopsis regifaucium TaxID=546365 RepID=A0A154MNK0_9PSEU|nr:spore germination protein GerW family protein [Amycolatopsis regifaucium]KZB85806.1 sporulation protein [Amycolatopsis regifaucium]OKA10439.1 sporulation protein [Amycolatopsis regifaucium]SFI76967.1 Sporulation protein YtfJ (Spore_YtfJ) [Amycolatopsis regifaucium]
MNVDELLKKAKDGLETKMVYGEPYHVDGVTVIVAAKVGSGGGGGDSRDEKGRSGEGVGFGLSVKPMGAYVIKDGKLRWEPAIDVSRVLATFGMIAVATLFAATRFARRKRHTETELS